MIIVVQCAASKQDDAGYLRQRDGQKVMFVAKPELAPGNPSVTYARPDDVSDTGMSWRNQLLEYNNGPGDNPLGLLPAWQLYENPTYGLLAEHYGVDKLFILSAGWGLIRGDFLTPNYDITFSAARNVEKYKRRGKKERYDDFRMLSVATYEPIVFFGGKDYVDLFCTLTAHIETPKAVFYNSPTVPPASGCRLVRFHTTTRTNWHYECARAFIEGGMAI